ncbi:hypothetical protein MFIFM68171_09943 [Madurella fahalii]|uniref:Uncharacterized protein n=1 Tax=Madurella fahalii TaxID=1157608 RepID=A0ABQ0GPR5_9PEZI
MFVLLSLHRGTQLQLTPQAMIEPEQLPEDTQKRIQLATFEDLARTLESPEEFEMLWKQRWLPMFKADIDQGTPGMEEWMTKLWLACTGRYTLTDFYRGRMYSGPDLDCFENMHLRRLLVGSTPFHGERCECVDKGWRPIDPGVPRAIEDPLTDGHHGVLTEYTDQQIVDVLFAFYDVRDPLGHRGLRRPLAETMPNWGFRALLEPLRQTEPMARMRKAHEYRDKAWNIKAALLNLEISPPQDAHANLFANNASSAATQVLRDLSQTYTDEDAPADPDTDE